MELEIVLRFGFDDAFFDLDVATYQTPLSVVKTYKITPLDTHSQKLNLAKNFIFPQINACKSTSF